MSLCVVGDFAWDVLIRTNNDVLKGGDSFGEVMLTPGGSAANVAVWARRCGLDTHFIGKIGRDRLGDLAREDLEREGVVHHFIQTDAQLTGSVAVFVDPTGERSMVSGRGADFFLLPQELPKSVINRSTFLHLTAWSFFTDPPRTAARFAAEIARAGDTTISFDPASFQMIEDMGVPTFWSYVKDLGIKVFLPNYEEGRALTGLYEPADIASAQTIVPPATNNLVDATGAGDSFAGAYLAHFSRYGSPVDAARFATVIAAWVIEHLGARPAADARLARVINAI
ncbi:MAG: carbohydrate kinase family protein [Actinobacteria bacterium]|nr:carbohydrate kinase family protein [Actinomycetota bacterium]